MQAALGECLAYSSLPADAKGLQLGLQIGAPRSFNWPKWTLTNTLHRFQHYKYHPGHCLKCLSISMWKFSNWHLLWRLQVYVDDVLFVVFCITFYVLCILLSSVMLHKGGWFKTWVSFSGGGDWYLDHYEWRRENPSAQNLNALPNTPASKSLSSLSYVPLLNQFRSFLFSLSMLRILCSDFVPVLFHYYFIVCVCCYFWHCRSR